MSGPPAPDRQTRTAPVPAHRPTLAADEREFRVGSLAGRVAGGQVAMHPFGAASYRRVSGDSAAKALTGGSARVAAALRVRTPIRVLRLVQLLC